jgi:hypothetical protein
MKGSESSNPTLSAHIAWAAIQRPQYFSLFRGEFGIEKDSLADDAVQSEPVSGMIYALTGGLYTTVVYAMRWFTRPGSLREGRAGG